MQLLRPQQLALVGTLTLAAASADAAWVVDPSLIVTTRYSDNITLSPDDEDDGINKKAADPRAGAGQRVVDSYVLRSLNRYGFHG